MASIEIAGNVRNHFIQAAVLLRMLNPVAASPPCTVLMKTYESRTPRDRLLNGSSLTLLPSFAPLKRTAKAYRRRGWKKASRKGLASNFGIGERTLGQLRELVGPLNIIGRRGTLSLVFIIKPKVRCWTDIILS